MVKDVFLRVNKKKFSNASDFDIGYLAGILDGEACFRLRCDKSREGTEFFAPRITIAVTDKRLFDRFAEMGIEPLIRSHRRFPHHKIVHIAVFSSNDLRVILPRVVKYLTIKKGHALVLIECLKLIDKRKVCSGMPLTEEELLERRILKTKITELNKRGA